MSIMQDPEVYERFDKVVLVHGCRQVSELAYAGFISTDLPRNELLGEHVTRQLIYYPTVTREPFATRAASRHCWKPADCAGRSGCPRWTPHATASCCAAVPPCSRTPERFWTSWGWPRAT